MHRTHWTPYSCRKALLAWRIWRKWQGTAKAALLCGVKSKRGKGRKLKEVERREGGEQQSTFPVTDLLLLHSARCKLAVHREAHEALAEQVFRSAWLTWYDLIILIRKCKESIGILDFIECASALAVSIKTTHLAVSIKQRSAYLHNLKQSIAVNICRGRQNRRATNDSACLPTNFLVTSVTLSQQGWDRFGRFDNRLVQS